MTTSENDDENVGVYDICKMGHSHFVIEVNEDKIEEHNNVAHQFCHR